MQRPACIPAFVFRGLPVPPRPGVGSAGLRNNKPPSHVYGTSRLPYGKRKRARAQAKKTPAKQTGGDGKKNEAKEKETFAEREDETIMKPTKDFATSWRTYGMPSV